MFCVVFWVVFENYLLFWVGFNGGGFDFGGLILICCRDFGVCSF